MLQFQDETENTSYLATLITVKIVETNQLKKSIK